ncbi:HAMP domain-containing sensor histidine kinase [Halomonas vilamensis]|uniref:histidine kinase n=1 Tax=Vreelandella vilamensis TaxID=531309 RepID=A0ABU1GZT8_9GAMM|nr:HAMP domain-containing sensor histidine kinase [Halomonas vilamensis]MDR5897571.1 HAMP domain-containing sensor histidine kinase [Halomonas vilamensis]
MMRRTGRLYRAMWAIILMWLPITAWAMPDFETFFEQHPTPMWMIAVESGEIVKANQAAKTFYGFERLEGMDIDEINMLTPEQVEQELRRVALADRNHLFFRHRLANGEVKVMGVYSDRFDVEGREVLISSLYDTSDFDSSAERHYVARVEEQVDLQTQQLQDARQREFWLGIGATLLQLGVIAILVVILLRLRRAQRENRRLIDELSFRNQELERLSQVMAHHFQEPSRRLVSFAQQLSQQLSQQPSQEPSQRDARLMTDEDNDEMLMAVGFIERQAKQLKELVSEIQRYLSLDVKPKPETLDSGQVIEVVCRDAPELAEMRREATVEIPQRLPPVTADVRQFKLIFRALLHNAWLYRDPERPLKIRITARTLDERVQFRVEDNGSGIAPEYREQVFDIFSRLVPHSDQYPGTGMGLALVVKALRNFDGHIAIEDGISGGTAIVFDLPLAR